MTSVPPGPAHEEVHHIIPQAQGGTDGPVVSLCDTHHTVLHKIAGCLHKKKGFEHLILVETPMAKQRLAWLGSMVYNAEVQMSDDPNKRTSVILYVDQRQRQMLDQLKRVYPAQRSRSAILALALEALYRKHFTT